MEGLSVFQSLFWFYVLFWFSLSTLISLVSNSRQLFSKERVGWTGNKKAAWDFAVKRLQFDTHNSNWHNKFVDLDGEVEVGVLDSSYVKHSLHLSRSPLTRVIPSSSPSLWWQFLLKKAHKVKRCLSASLIQSFANGLHTHRNQKSLLYSAKTPVKHHSNILSREGLPRSVCHTISFRYLRQQAV